MTDIPVKKSAPAVFVRKASGDEAPFSSEKLERSLRNAGADKKSVGDIVADVERWIYNGVTTKAIYTRAFSLLSRKKNKAALRYKIKQAILQLGPTGYPFEHLVGQIFERQGYTVSVGELVEGHCVSHEMDVIATYESVQHLVECKYSKDQGKQVSIQVPLYVQARVEDIIKKRKQMEVFRRFSFTGGVATNTRFSEESVAYGKCAGLKLLGWDYPEGNGLKELIEQLGIYPVTVLNYLKKNEKDHLMYNGIVTCLQIMRNPEVLEAFQLREKKYASLMRELEDVCGG